MNGQYMKSLPTNHLVNLLKPELNKFDFDKVCDEYLGKVIDLFRERITFLKDVLTFGNYMFEKPKEFEADYIAKH
jgi:hypothetical protein